MMTSPRTIDVSPFSLFSSQMEQECRVGSGIPGELLRAAVAFHSQVESGPGGEALFPIHSALNWSRFPRFGYQARADQFAALFLQEAGAVWQAKLAFPLWDGKKGQFRKYESPVGGGSQPFLPPVDGFSWFKVAQAHDLVGFLPSGLVMTRGDRRDWVSHSRGVLSPEGFRSCGERLQPLLMSQEWRRPEFQFPIETSSFWQWVALLSVLPLVVTEGGKKALALLAQGHAAIALYGVHGGYRSKDALGQPISPTLIPELLPFLAPGREVVLAFDQDGKPKSRQTVAAAIAQFGQLLVHRGCSVRVAVWEPELGKGVDDLLVTAGAQAVERALASASALELWQVGHSFALSFPVALRLNHPFLGEVPIPDSAQFIGFKSPKGTGKTTALRPLVAQAIAQGTRVLLLTHRVQLGQALADTVGVPYLSEVPLSPVGGLLGFALCTDSLHPLSLARFNPLDWQGALVIVDEAEQVVWHTLQSITCRSQRVSILLCLQRLLTSVLASGGRVLLSDADLSDLSVNFVRSLVGGKFWPWILENRWRPLPWRVFCYDDPSPKRWLAALSEAIASGQRVLVLVDSQKVRSLWSSRSLEVFLARWTDAPILRIDSESISDPSHPAFGCMGALNQVLQGYGVVIASPSLESGVSIDLVDHFDSVWGCFQGTLSDNSVRQMLARLRQPLDRHLWVRSYGLGRVGSGSGAPQVLLREEREKGVVHQLQLPLVLEEGMELESALETWGAMGARLNRAMPRFREAVMAGLRFDGHQVEAAGVPALPLEDCFQQLQQAQQLAYRQECEAIADGDLLSVALAARLEEQRAKTLAEVRRLRQFHLYQRYGVPVTPPLVARDDGGWFAQLQLHYHLTVGRDFLIERDRRMVESILHQGQSWLPDFNRVQLGVKVGILAALQVLSLQDRSFSGEDLLAQQVALKAIANARAIRTGFGIRLRFNANKPLGEQTIPILRQLIAPLGLSLRCLGKVGPRGHQKRVYQFAGFDDGREAVFAGWLQRDLTDTGHSSEATSAPSSESPVATQNDHQQIILASGDDGATPSGHPPHRAELTSFIPDGGVRLLDDSAGVPGLEDWFDSLCAAWVRGSPRLQRLIAVSVSANPLWRFFIGPHGPERGVP